jgi:hypothetical protein
MFAIRPGLASLIWGEYRKKFFRPGIASLLPGRKGLGVAEYTEFFSTFRPSHYYHAARMMGGIACPRYNVYQ